jgi:hypothetical protein
VRTLKLTLGALFLSVVNQASIVVGFLCFKLSASDEQLAVQVPVTLITGIVLAAVLVRRLRRFLGPARGADHATVFLLAFPLGAAVFTPVHYVFTGYLTSFGNIAGLWMVQLFENAIAIPLGSGAWSGAPRAKAAGNGDARP